jgi:hypothetical protein
VSLAYESRPPVSTGVPLYCPHDGCPWSYDRAGSRGEGFLAVHLRVVHKGVDPRPAKPEQQKRPALASVEGRKPEEAAQKRDIEPDTKTGQQSENGSVEPQREDTRMDTKPCRTPGCSNAANTRYGRGPYANLCDELCIPKRRIEIGRINSAAHARRGAGAGKLAKSSGLAVTPAPPEATDGESPPPVGAPLERQAPEPAPAIAALDASPEPPVPVEAPPVDVLGRLRLTGDFTRDAQRIRQEASVLRKQADALDQIAIGVDALAEAAA